MPNPKKPRRSCLACGGEPARAAYKYCCIACQAEYQHRTYIKAWKEGKVSGLKSIGIVSRHVKRYLRQKFGNKCSLCGWSMVNKKTGIVPLVADHVDGNWRNNSENNLRLLCPNCDSLNPTYAGLNKGRGRPDRIKSKRMLEAGLISKSRSSSVGRAPLS